MKKYRVRYSSGKGRQPRPRQQEKTDKPWVNFSPDRSTTKALRRRWEARSEA